MKSLLAAALTIVSLLLSSQGFAGGASLSQNMKPLPTGQIAPNFAFTLPISKGEAAELGIKPDAKAAQLNDVQADAMVLVVFSMYCTYCQGEASELAALHALIKDKGLSGKLTLLGLGAGNSPFEVNVFRKKYGLKFPLLSDPDFAAHKALGEVGTPYYYILKRRGNEFVIVDQLLGCMTSSGAFLDSVLDKTGLR
ncbi:MAG: peroxiredoxin family protein [Desulfovibrio sp.]